MAGPSDASDINAIRPVKNHELRPNQSKGFIESIIEGFLGEEKQGGISMY